MFLIRLFRFVAGYVLFSAVGGFPERFINLCTAGHIPIWDIRPCGNVLYGKVRAKDYLRLRTVSRKSGMRLRLRKKCGVPFFMHKHRKHGGLLIGAAVFLAVFALLSTRIWVIEIEHLQGVPESVIRTALRDAGIYEGMRTRSLEASKTESALPLQIPKIQWVALNRQGSVLHVRLRAKIRTQAEQDASSPCHLVAAKDGVLRTLEPYDGKAMVRVPTAVQKGQLLISGITDNKDGSVCLHHAKGYTEAQTTAAQTVTVSKKQTFPAVSTALSKVSVRLFGRTFPPTAFQGVEDAQFFSYDMYLTAGKYRLPVSCNVHRSTFFQSSRTLSDKETMLLLFSDFETEAAQRFHAARFLSQDIRLSQDTKTLRIEADFHLLENIVAEQEILLEE
ncbi:MAG: sporulation protein YqfD [Oscillospiraceae bacterium]|nr:sporulation protein YqfD [Oscillospiraceae bacterium]